MRILKLAAAAIFALTLLGGQTAWAHSSMTSTPQNEAVLAESPEFIEVKFGRMMRVLKFNILNANQDEIGYVAEAGKKFTQTYRAKIDALATGTYFVTWRAIGKDGHPMKNKFSFTIE